MKQHNNNEVDILLQALARGGRDTSLSQGKPASEGQNPATSNHLDADELNSYAEGVVPAPARTRYTEHLADCDRCRGIVISLTQAAGAATKYEVLEQQTSAGFWQKFAALFSPPVLRYAVPALALTAVIAISLLALRQQQRQSDFVAQQQPLTTTPPLSQPAQTESPAVASTSEGPSAIQKGVESPANSGLAKEKKNSADDRSVAKSPDVPADAAASAPPVVAKAAPKSGEEFGVAQSRPTFAPEPPPTPPASRAATTESEKAGALRKDQPMEREVLNRQQEESKRGAYRNEVRDEDQTHGPARGAVTSVGRRRVDGLSAGSGGPRKDKKDSGGDVETRAVAGRRFRHEGNTWVDTAYESSRATTKVSRGSEQFRALTADEPAIRSIAEQLDGVVIVVWKGRAYRIQ